MRQQGVERAKIRVGHAGTLDPFATGLLIIGVGRDTTKRLDEFKKLPKTYVATIHLGAVSDTYDKTGTIHDIYTLYRDKPPSEQLVLEILQTFKGKQRQIPPMYSAKKINGQRLYTLARQGIEIERNPVAIEIYTIKLVEYTWPFLKIEVQCSTGTYIRSLAHDIGQKLGVGAYCEELTRTKIGEYVLKDAAILKKLI